MAFLWLWPDLGIGPVSRHSADRALMPASTVTDRKGHRRTMFDLPMQALLAASFAAFLSFVHGCAARTRRAATSTERHPSPGQADDRPVRRRTHGADIGETFNAQPRRATGQRRDRHAHDEVGRVHRPAAVRLARHHQATA
jgi:hypothetical protein